MDDLWYLYQLIRPGCIVGSHTYRKLETREDKVRPDSQPRIKVYLKIKVSSAEFHPFTDDLRVGGEIISGPDDISGHHTFNLEPGKMIDLELPSITREERSFLKDSLDPTARSRAMAISLDDESAQIFRFRDYGVEQIASIRTSGGGKQFGGSGNWDDYYREIAETLSHNISDGIPLILVGPGFFKESLSKILRETLGLDPSTIHMISASSGGLRGLNEAFLKGEGLSSAVKGLRYQKETSMVNRLMEAVGKGKGATYGDQEVSKALKMGAVETLLITETIFREGIGRDLLSLSTQMGSKGMIISTSHEAGKMLDKIGGIAAILRFEI